MFKIHYFINNLLSKRINKENIQNFDFLYFTISFFNIY